jgi:hypothetical protein
MRPSLTGITGWNKATPFRLPLETSRLAERTHCIKPPVEDWGKLLGDSAAVTAMLDRLLHHGHILKCGPRSWRTKLPAEQ